MEEQQIIAKLKGLKRIKPDSEWTEVTKSYILGINKPQEKVFSGDFLSFFSRLNMSRLPSFRLQPAIVVSLLAMVVVGAAIFSYFSFNSSGKIAKNPSEDSGAAYSAFVYLDLAQTKLAQIDGSENIPENIKEVTEILGKAAEKMSSVPKDPGETAKMVASLSEINKKVKELDGQKQNAEALKELKEKADVLTTKAAEALEDNIKSTSAELTGNLIKMLETKTLTDEQKALFKEAKSDYNNKNYEQALEKILILTNEQNK